MKGMKCGTCDTQKPFADFTPAELAQRERRPTCRKCLATADALTYHAGLMERSRDYRSRHRTGRTTAANSIAHRLQHGITDP